MKRSLLALLVVPLIALTPAAQATTVTDPAGDFIPGFIGPANPDLDVTNFSVGYNSATSIFSLGATLAGDINPATAGFYVIGVNTGTGVIAPFASVGAPNVIFNQAIVIRKDGTGSIGATALDPSTIAITGNIFTVRVPLALLPTTGFAPGNYGFNLWPRVALGNNNQISDFAPNNATISANGAVPEPATWGMMLVGFGVAGMSLRRNRRARLARA
ncbi:PEPxxWA-CTERM sorting domain-containing protein [Sphingomonas sp.]|uniref:PEPxxWA-CTERM sorting domain-containing protein n=1 Tax=Sphingomonas sp. TaxID=28214 RepID=UPI00286C145D|nr:PEPxxWA-CTERM sorting domain-containing protein [Sphingomonas sp.]